MEPDLLKFIRWLYRSRRAEDLTQKALAEKSGVCGSEICKLENGSRNEIRLVTAVKLARGFGKKLWMVLQELDI